MITIDLVKKAALDAEVKNRLLADAMTKRDVLLQHLAWMYIKATEEPDVSKAQAISAAIASLQGIFTDSRVVGAIDGAVKAAVKIVYLEIFQALYAASPSAYNALKALDPL
jgi:hypothetical protein